jgi:hypothetical protein
MPVLIDEVCIETIDTVTQPGEAEPAPQQIPVAAAEQQVLQTLALIQQRQDRLKID